METLMVPVWWAYVAHWLLGFLVGCVVMYVKVSIEDLNVPSKRCD